MTAFDSARALDAGIAAPDRPAPDQAAPGKGPDLGGGSAPAWLAQEIRAGHGAAARLRDVILPSLYAVADGGTPPATPGVPAVLPVDADAALRRIELALARTDPANNATTLIAHVDSLPAALIEPRARLADEYGVLKPKVDVLRTKADAKATGTAQPAPRTGPGPAPLSHGFKPVPAEPAAGEVLQVVLDLNVEIMQLPLALRAQFDGVTAGLAGETVVFKVLLMTEHRVGLYLERHKTAQTTERVLATVDLVDVAAKVAVAGMAGAGAFASFITGSTQPLLRAVGGNRVRLDLSKPKAPNNVPDFVVFDVYQLLRAIADSSWDTFRPDEAQLGLGPVTAARYQGQTHTDDKAFAGRGIRVGDGSDQTVAIPGLRHLVFGESGKDADLPLFISGATDGRNLTLGFARDKDHHDGAAFTFDVVRIVELAAKVIGKIAPPIARGLEALIKTVGKGAVLVGDAVTKVFDFAAGLLSFRLPKGKGTINFSLRGLLAAIVKAGKFTVDVFASLLPDSFDLPDFGFVGKIGETIWDGLQLLGDMAEISGDVLAKFLAAAGSAGLELLGEAADLAGGIASIIGDVSARAGLVIVDASKQVLGVFLELIRGKKKRRVGFKLPFGAIAGFLGKVLAFVGKAAGKLLGKAATGGAKWFKDHLSLGSDGVLRLLLDDPPKAGGNRVGMDLVPLITSGGDPEHLRLTETFLDGSLTDIYYGPVVAEPKPGDPPKQQHPAAVKLTRPPGGAIAESNLPAPKWMATLWGLDADKPLKTELIVGSKGIHIWSQQGADHAFDIRLTLPVPKMIAKRMPKVQTDLFSILDDESKAQKRVVIGIGKLAKNDKGKTSGIVGKMSWSLDQWFAASSFEDALTPEQLVIDDGTWAITMGEKVDITSYQKHVDGMIPPPSVRSWFPIGSVDVFVKADDKRFGIFVANHSSLANQTHAVGMGVDVTKERFEQLRSKLPKLPGVIDKHLPISVAADPDGLKIWLGAKDDPHRSWVKYAWAGVVDFMAGAATLEDLVPDQAHLDASKAGLALEYQTLKPADVPPGTMRTQVKNLPDAVGALVHSFHITDEHWLHVDPTKSTLTNDGSRIAIAGAVYKEVGPKKDKQGWKVGLEVDAIKLLTAFLPKSVMARLQKAPSKKRGVGMGFTVDPGDKDKHTEPSLAVWIQYVHQRGSKKKEFGLEAKWTVHDLVDLLMHLGDIKDHPEYATPSALTGSAGNGSFTLKFGINNTQPKGTRLEHLEMAIIPILARVMTEDHAKEVQLWLDFNEKTLMDSIKNALIKKEPLKLAGAYLVLPSSEIVGTTYEIDLIVEPGAIYNLAMMIPGGFYVKLAKFLIEFLQDPQGKLDDVVYGAAAIPLLIKHRDIFKKIDWDSMSIKDVAMAVLLNDEDTRGAYRSLKAFDKLVEAGWVDKDNLPKITGEMARRAMARDPEAARQQIDLIYNMPMDEIKQMKKTRDLAGSKEQFDKIIAFASSISLEDRKLMSKLMAMYEKKGISLDEGHIANWSPDKAIMKLASMKTTLARLEAAEAGNRAEEQLRKRDPNADGRDGDVAVEQMKAHLAGKDVTPGPALDVKKLDQDQLVSILRSGFAVLTRPDGTPYVHHATDAERKAAGEQLMSGTVQTTSDGKPGKPMSPDEVLAQYDELHRTGGLGVLDAVAALREEKITITEAQLIKAAEANPGWAAKHRHGPAEFGAPDLAVDSIQYAVYIARFQAALHVTVDGVAGPGAVALLEQQKKLAKDRAAQAKAEGKDGKATKDGKDGKDGKDAKDTKDGKGGDGGGGDGDGSGNGTGQGGDGKGGQPSGSYIPMTYEQSLSLVRWDATTQKLVMLDGVPEMFTQARDPAQRTATSKEGLTGRIHQVDLKTWHVSRDNAGQSPQISYQFDFFCSSVVQDEDGRYPFFRVYSKTFVFFVDSDEHARGGYARQLQKLPELMDAVRGAVNVETGAIKTRDLKTPNYTVEIDGVNLVQRGAQVVMTFKRSPDDSFIYDDAVKRYVPMVGQVTVFLAKPKAKPDRPGDQSPTQ